MTARLEPCSRFATNTATPAASTTTTATTPMRRTPARIADRAHHIGSRARTRVRSHVMADVVAPVSGSEREARPNLLRNWKYVLATTNPPRGAMDPVSKWLYLTRAGV